MMTVHWPGLPVWVLIQFWKYVGRNVSIFLVDFTLALLESGNDGGVEEESPLSSLSQLIGGG
jgi:hypothetical protein